MSVHLGIFREKEDGKFSAVRTVLLLWTVIAIGLWTWLSIKNCELQEFPASVAGIIGSLGIGKAAQRFAESWENRPK